MDVQKLIDEYISWLRSEITFEKIGEYYEITTPYLDNANDYLQIYVKQDGNEILFTDDASTIQGLKMSGLQFTPNRKELLKRILFQYGVVLNGDELTCKAQVNNFAQKKHMFLQAMLKIDDMFSITKARVSSYFLEDIQEFFLEREIYCSENVQFTGVSGFSHNYDFLLQRSHTKPERLCRAVNNPSKTSMGNVLFAWNDTKPSRRPDSQLIVFLNDVNGISRGIEEAFENYSAGVIPWSERNSEKYIKLIS